MKNHLKEIDAVITWVDGNDPVHRAKRQKYGPSDIFKSDDVAGDTRFSSLGEIFWCVASLNRYAPFLRKIYIVTDEQNPGLDDFLKKSFPEGYIPVEIIDHKVIFRGYEQYLPTFNSISLETVTWRIPGLSEHYIELNDDFMLINPVSPEDFFTESGDVVCYADKYNMFWTWLTRKIKRKNHGREKVTFKGVMWNAARLAGQRGFFLKINHTPRALRKSFFEDYFSTHPDALERNISHRFRHSTQFTPQELQYLMLYRQGRCVLKPVRDNMFFFQPKDKDGYVARKLDRLDRVSGKCKFCCFNSIDKAEPDDRKSIIAWIEHRLGVSLGL